MSTEEFRRIALRREKLLKDLQAMAEAERDEAVEEVARLRAVARRLADMVGRGETARGCWLRPPDGEHDPLTCLECTLRELEELAKEDS